MDNPFFSIIIPTYNSGHTLEKCLDSIMIQTFENFEILIIDGGSTDNTIEVSNSFLDARIKIISEEDNGIYDAMNKGIEKAQGKWLYFLGSDDTLFRSETLNSVYLSIKKTKKPVIYGNVLVNNDAGWAKSDTVYNYEFNLPKILKKNICHQAIFYKKEIIKKHKFNINYRVCADYDLNLRLFSKYSFQYIEEIIANFTGGGFSTHVQDDTFDKNELILNYFLYKLYSKNFSFMITSIRHKTKNTENILLFFYLYIIYLKHRLFLYISHE